MPERILIVDDDSSILALVSDLLTDNGFSVAAAADAQSARKFVASERFDLIILDVMMKGTDGYELCGEIRGKVGCPIIFLSARDSSKDIVKGLSLGADDYLTKPFVLDELLARINAHLRRETRTVPKAQGRVTVGDISLDIAGRNVTKAGETVELSTREFDVLAYLMKNAGVTVSREQLYREVWGSEYGDIGTVAINIKNIRAKIDPEWEYIKTIWGSGYRFAAPSEEPGE